jgi:hypothetical protein
METTIKLSAIRVANQLDLKGIKGTLELKPLADTSSELFYCLGPDKYQYFFNYGVIVFTGYREEEINQAVKNAQPFLKNPDKWLRDDHSISVESGAGLHFEFDQLIAWMPRSSALPC